MNQFRDLTILLLVGVSFGLIIGNPDDWKWVDAGGPYVTQTVSFLVTTKPFSIAVLMAVALTLFMTRLKF